MRDAGLAERRSRRRERFSLWGLCAGPERLRGREAAAEPLRSARGVRFPGAPLTTVRSRERREPGGEGSALRRGLDPGA
eukprot:2109520-Alexandrium_andersonii.AAC.1